MNRFVWVVTRRFVTHHHLDLIHDANYAEGVGDDVCDDEWYALVHLLLVDVEVCIEESHHKDYEEPETK